MEAKRVLVKEGDVAIITCSFCSKTKKVVSGTVQGKKKT